jgi:hypothetical protein
VGPKALADLIHDGANLRPRISAKPLIYTVIRLPIEPDGRAKVCHTTQDCNARSRLRALSFDHLVGASEEG